MRGKRVGVPDYAMTAALWFRSFLKELYGIKPQEVSWYIGRLKQFSHGAILGIDKDPPAGVSLNWLTEEQTFDRMLDRGDLDAAYSIVPSHDPKLQTFGNNIDRYGGTRDRWQSPPAKIVCRWGPPIDYRLFPERPASCQLIIRLPSKSVCSTSIPGWRWSYSSSSKRLNRLHTKTRNAGARLIFISKATTQLAKLISLETIPIPMASRTIAGCWSSFPQLPRGGANPRARSGRGHFPPNHLGHLNRISLRFAEAYP